MPGYTYRVRDIVCCTRVIRSKKHCPLFIALCSSRKREREREDYSGARLGTKPPHANEINIRPKASGQGPIILLNECARRLLWKRRPVPRHYRAYRVSSQKFQPFFYDFPKRCQGFKSSFLLLFFYLFFFFFLLLFCIYYWVLKIPRFPMDVSSVKYFS